MNSFVTIMAGRLRLMAQGEYEQFPSGHLNKLVGSGFDRPLA
jgi:hypothetical protein